MFNDPVILKLRKPGLLNRKSQFSLTTWAEHKRCFCAHPLRTKVLLLGPESPHHPVRQALQKCSHAIKLEIDKNVHQCCLRCRIAAWGEDDLCSPLLPCTECEGEPPLYYELVQKNIARNNYKQKKRKEAKLSKTSLLGLPKKGYVPLEFVSDNRPSAITGDLEQSENLKENDSHGIATYLRHA